MDEFRAGVTACLRSWSALRTAVESGWGGVDSASKAESLRAYIFEHFDGTSCPPRTITQDDLEDNLAIYMEEEFSIVLEDNSERQVAETIWRMYEACAQGDTRLASEVVAAAETAVASVAAYPVQIQSNEHDDDTDDDDEDMMGEEGEAETSTTSAPTLVPVPTPQAQQLPPPAEYAALPLFGPPKKVRSGGPSPRQLGEAAPAPAPTVELDQDGFASVQTAKRKKNRKPL